MKIGLSFSRCVADIFDEKVDINDVLVVVSRTDFDPKDDKHWKSIWNGYISLYSNSTSSWIGYDAFEQEFRDIAIQLHEDGKLHQPRQYGANPPRTHWNWLETFAPEEDVEKNPAVKKAWDQYKLLAGLS